MKEIDTLRSESDKAFKIVLKEIRSGKARLMEYTTIPGIPPLAQFTIRLEHETVTLRANKHKGYTIVSAFTRAEKRRKKAEKRAARDERKARANE